MLDAAKKPSAFLIQRCRHQDKVDKVTQANAKIAVFKKYPYELISAHYPI